MVNNVDNNGDDGNCIDSSRFETICNKNDTLVTGTSNTLEALFSSRFQSASEDVWHQRLDHSQRVVGTRLSKAGSIKLTSMSKAAEVCTSCQSSKSSKLPIIFRPCSASLDKLTCHSLSSSPSSISGSSSARPNDENPELIYNKRSTVEPLVTVEPTMVTIESTVEPMVTVESPAEINYNERPTVEPRDQQQ
ncbi:hypothetical protein NE237_001893 [Protea cynaroides]|uniref:GAG-pre-integrase domain-containing protein n=1 Tax=Protea cynaroides TaxID=273540 RepID=A0A9Q0KU80_9MAGN|nr:hypothetical protein NE237_001893 [Protea cynaroides]